MARLSVQAARALAPNSVDARLHHLAPDTDRFAALMKQRSLAGLHVEPMPPMKVRDRYLDTAAGDLLGAGWTLRLRAQDGYARATLRPLDGHAAGAGERYEEPAEVLPDGPVRMAARSIAGPEPLDTLLALRQYRTPRAVYDGRRLVGVLSLDVVTDDAGEVPESWHEVETKLAPSGTAADLRRLGDDLCEWGFAPLARTKFERALFRLGRETDGPLLLLPDERAALEALRDSDSSVARRRAEVVLLAVAGLPTRTVSYKAGLSPSRVRHWKHAFRHERMDIFDMEEPETAADDEAAVGDAGGFRVSELVEPPPTPGPSDATFVDILDAVMERANRHPGTPILRDTPGEDRTRHGS